MNCPVCHSNRLTQPRYGAVPGGGRIVVVRLCLACRAVVGARKAG